jgi:hypothetical protein
LATCTFRVGTADTGATPNTSGSFSPASGDLLIVLFCASASASANEASWAVTSSIGGFTFSAVERGGGGTGSDRLQVFVSDALVSDTSSQTVTVTNTTDQGNGSIIFVYSVSGMSEGGTGAIRQFKAVGPELESVDLEATFDSACLTSNPTLVVMSNGSNPAGVDPPTGWTESASGDLGYNTPTQGAAVAHRDSGFTGTTVTWATNSATPWGAIILELNAVATHSGSGAATLPLPTASGTGKRSLNASGAAALPLLTAAGTGKKTRPGTGAATLPALAASGAGKKARSGDGAATLPLLDADGTGKRSLKGSGEPDLPLLTADGDGEIATPGVFSGSGAVVLPFPTAAGTGKRSLLGSGAAVLPFPTASGTGEGGAVVVPTPPLVGGSVARKPKPIDRTETPSRDEQDLMEMIPILLLRING